jgi:hypothetical protein
LEARKPSRWSCASPWRGASPDRPAWPAWPLRGAGFWCWGGAFCAARRAATGQGPGALGSALQGLRGALCAMDFEARHDAREVLRWAWMYQGRAPRARGSEPGTATFAEAQRPGFCYTLAGRLAFATRGPGLLIERRWGLNASLRDAGPGWPTLAPSIDPTQPSLEQRLTPLPAPRLRSRLALLGSSAAPRFGCWRGVACAGRRAAAGLRPASGCVRALSRQRRRRRRGVGSLMALRPDSGPGRTNVPATAGQGGGTGGTRCFRLMRERG